MTVERTALLPCPFCGGLSIACESTRKTSWRVMCYADCDIFGDFDTREEAVAGWNRRALAPIVPPDTEAIEWARELDRAARRYDDARSAVGRHAAARDINNLILDDERMVQIARALLARVDAGDDK